MKNLKNENVVIGARASLYSSYYMPIPVLGLYFGDTLSFDTAPLLVPHFDLILPTKSAISHWNILSKEGGQKQKRGYPLNIGLKV